MRQFKGANGELAVSGIKECGRLARGGKEGKVQGTIGACGWQVGKMPTLLDLRTEVRAPLCLDWQVDECIGRRFVVGYGLAEIAAISSSQALSGMA